IFKVYTQESGDGKMEESNKDESNKVPIDGNEVVLYLAGTRFDRYNGSAQASFQTACPADWGYYAYATLAWIGVQLEDQEPTLLNLKALHILRDQACTGRDCIGGLLMVVVAPRLKVVGSSGQ
nr:hypothetical protein [Tanacetum cinerariifolium]